MAISTEQKPRPGLRARLHEIIFESDTPAGKAFDVALLWAIVFSVTAAVLDSVSGLRARYGLFIYAVEWTFTILFTIEYALRLASVRRPVAYATSFFGVVDLMAILPTYLSVLLPGAQSLLVVRVLRLLRVFRVLKLASFLDEAQVLLTALRASRRKITVFLLAVLSIVTVMAALMYLVEGPENGFENIPMAMYWSIVTLTTVGFGDITPKTDFGRLLASMLMIIGYGIIAVPTGIVSVELANATRAGAVSAQACPSCGAEGHDSDARHCKYCGAGL